MDESIIDRCKPIGDHPMSQQTNGNAPIHANGTMLPALRPLDIRHHNENGHPYLLLRDPLELSEQMIAVPQPLASVLAFCDGAHDIDGMAAAFTDYFQTPIDVAVVHQLVEALDNAYLLDNERSQQAVAKVVEAYRSAPFRTPLLAGRGYPDDPAELHGLLQDYLEQASATPISADQWPRRAGLLSPHIDYARGGAVYAEVWKSAAEAAKAAELVVIFGTDHYGNDPFTLTRQNYATPYGILPTALPIVDELALLLGEDAAFAGELRHRDEHSLELVAVWLHHMRGGEPVEIVPILTGSLRRAGRNGNGARPIRLRPIRLRKRCLPSWTNSPATGACWSSPPAIWPMSARPSAARRSMYPCENRCAGLTTNCSQACRTATPKASASPSNASTTATTSAASRPSI